MSKKAPTRLERVLPASASTKKQGRAGTRQDVGFNRVSPVSTLKHVHVVVVVVVRRRHSNWWEKGKGKCNVAWPYGASASVHKLVGLDWLDLTIPGLRRGCMDRCEW